MKVALCLTGHFRSFDTCWPKIKSSTIDIYKPDIFAMGWKDTFGNFLHPHQTTDNFTHRGYEPDSPEVGMDYVSSVIDRLQPKDFHLDHYYLHDQTFEELANKYKNFMPDGDQYHRPKGTLSMAYCRWVAMKMKREQEVRQGWRYDRVILTRWDVICNNEINFNLHDEHKITVSGPPHPVWPCDLWMSGNSANMDTLANMYPGIEELARTGKMDLCPHIWMMYWLEHKGIKYEHTTAPDTIFIR